MDHKSLRKIALGIILVLGMLNAAVQSATKELGNGYNRKMGLGIVNEQKQEADFKSVSGTKKYNVGIGINPAPNVETQRLLVEATKELVALMDRDYKGMNSPKHRPPIHN